MHELQVINVNFLFMFTTPSQQEFLLPLHKSVGLPHHEHNKGSPASERTTPLSTACAVIVLLPQISTTRILFLHIADHIFPQFSIKLSGQCTVGTIKIGIMMEGTHCQIVHVYPDWTSPIWGIVWCIAAVIEWCSWRQGPQAIWCPEKVSSLKVLENLTQLRGVWINDLEEKWEETHISKGINVAILWRLQCYPLVFWVGGDTTQLNLVSVEAVVHVAISRIRPVQCI